MNQNEIDQRIARLKGTQGKDYYQQQAEHVARVQQEHAQNRTVNVIFPPERPTPPAPLMVPAVERKFRTAWATAQNEAGTSNQPKLADLATFLAEEKKETEHYNYIRREAIRLGILQGRSPIEATDETHAQMQARLFAENVNRPPMPGGQAQSPRGASSFEGIRRPGE